MQPQLRVLALLVLTEDCVGAVWNLVSPVVGAVNTLVCLVQREVSGRAAAVPAVLKYLVLEAIRLTGVVEQVPCDAVALCEVDNVPVRGANAPDFGAI